MLSSNQLSGQIPAELGQLAALAYLNLTSNALSGLIPAELQQLGALTDLYLDDNHQLTGRDALYVYMEEHNPNCFFSL